MNTLPVTFILNNELIRMNTSWETILVDFIRYNNNLYGTKIGCREGDCGACTVILGELVNDEVEYKSINSCLTPLGNVIGKHVVTIEGLNSNPELFLTPIQSFIIEEQGTQCGFCTTGFVMSMTASCFHQSDQIASSKEFIDGNICRCTGYKSIERACKKLDNLVSRKLKGEFKLNDLIENGIIPQYFGKIKQKLLEIKNGFPIDSKIYNENSSYIGGGTDLYVQKPDTLLDSKDGVNYLYLNNSLKIINEIDNTIRIGSGVTFSQLMDSDLIQGQIPNLHKFMKLIASTPIRNLATIGGNIVNASPIGDLTIIFLALNSSIELTKSNETRKLKLNEFFIDYKNTELKESEIISSINFEKDWFSHFNFEKVSKRTHLDIASVNSSIALKVSDTGLIESVSLSGGGLAPIPIYFKKTSEFLRKKEINESNILQAIDIAQKEVNPISDIRGSKEYKLLLLKQLIYSHFITLFPEKITMEAIAP